MQAKYRWLVDEGITKCDGSTLVAPSAVAQWFAQRRSYLLGQLDPVAASFTIAGPTSFATNNNPVMLRGSAPIEVVSLMANGVALTPTWDTVNGFSVSVPLSVPRTNLLALQGVDAHGRPVAGTVVRLAIDYTGPPLPEWSLQVRINEWMADNAVTIPDPADQQSDDWFELYNTGAAPADLSGFTLTDDLAAWAKWTIPAGTIVPPRSFLLVWADNEPEQNTTTSVELHAGFQLSKGGDTIALFAPSGTLVDLVQFGPQAEDVTEGRYPDGDGGAAFLTRPTPNAPNAVPYSETGDALQLDPQAFVYKGDEVVFGWLATRNHVYQIQYADDLSQPEWLPVSGDLTATASVLSARALLSTQDHRFFRVVDLSGP